MSRSIKEDGSIVNGLVCPKCTDIILSKVIESRQNRLSEAGMIVRRRECLSCGCRWSTVEVNRAWFRKINKYE